MSYLGISMVTVRFFFILTKLVDMPRAIQYTVSAHTISMKSTQVFIRLHLRFSDLMGSRLNLLWTKKLDAKYFLAYMKAKKYTKAAFAGIVIWSTPLGGKYSIYDISNLSF